MVAGAFGSNRPFSSATPDRIRICPSKPSGIAIAKPVGMICRSPELMVTGLLVATRRSSPAAAAEAYSGSSAGACGSRFIVMRRVKILRKHLFYRSIRKIKGIGNALIDDLSFYDIQSEEDFFVFFRGLNVALIRDINRVRQRRICQGLR